MLRTLLLILFCNAPAAFGQSGAADLYDELIDANRAQLVMLAEEGLMDRALAGRLALALDDIAAGAETPAERSSNYLDLEARLVARLGPEATNIHLGRSRNDLGAAMNRMALRAQLLETMQALTDARTVLVAMARTHRDTIAPGLTHAVQAQPTTLGHILLALDAHLARDQARFEEGYARLNLSPLGAAAITTSGFPLDRERLAGLLGFDGLVVNAYDAIVIASGDSKLELTQTAALSAIIIGRFAQDLLFQYDDPAPGLVLTAEASGRSSIMPQKRNPSSIERLRVAASEVTGLAQTALFYAHNTPMHEVRDTRAPLFFKTEETLAATIDMYVRLKDVLESIDVREDALRAKVDSDYATMTELADMLHREGGLAFRDGYAFASALTIYGRREGKTPNEIAFGEARRVFRELFGEDLPVDEATFRAAIDAGEMVARRAGTGGPQPRSMDEMIASAEADLAEAQDFVASQQARLDAAKTRLDHAFEQLKP